jgi:tetratricopeptide (TPR) repeat protein
LLIIVLLLAPSAYAGEAARHERHLTKGILFLDLKEYPKALEELQAALKEKPDDASANLYYGVALCNTGNDAEGEKYLKKALKLDPASVRANYELGVLYYRRGLYDEARDFFETVKGAEPKTELTGLAEEHLKEIGKQKPLEKNWEVSLTTGIQYDNNVVLEPTSGVTPEGIARKSDWRAVVFLEGRYAFRVRDNVSIVPNYSFYQSMQSVLDDFNTTQHLPGVYIDYVPLRAVTLRLHYNFEYTAVDYRTYVKSHIIQPVVTIAEGQGFYTQLRYRYQRKHFNDTKLFPDNTQRDGFNSLFGVKQYIPVHQMVIVTAGYVYDKDKTDDDAWHYNGNAGELGLIVDFGKGWNTDLSGLYYCKGYKGKYMDTGKRRRDITHSYAVNLTKILNTRWDVIAGYLYEINDSSIKYFDYERQIVSLMVRMKL